MLGTTLDKFALTPDVEQMVPVLSRNHAFYPDGSRSPGECLNNYINDVLPETRDINKFGSRCVLGAPHRSNDNNMCFYIRFCFGMMEIMLGNS